MAPQKHIIINAAPMSMRGNLITGAYLKTIAASFWPGCSSVFRRILDCTGADLETLRQAKRRQSNQYSTGSELVESFFHLGFKTACKHEGAATPALPQPDVNRWLR